MQQRSSILTELSWLLFFAVVFVVLVYALNIFVVPHHFNDKVAVAIAALMAGIVMIAVRARWRR